MRSVRAHLLSVLAVCFALAVGIVLGSGPLRGERVTSLVDQATGGTPTRSTQVRNLERSSAYADDVTRATAPALLGNSLQGHVVTVLALPSAGRSEVRAVSSLIGVAGGRVGMTLRAGTPLVDVRSRQLVDELGTQLAERSGGVKAAADASSYERIGMLLGRAVGTRTAGGAPVDKTARDLFAGLSTAGLVSSQGATRQRGDLVLLVTGAGTGTVRARSGSGTVVATLARAVDRTTRGVVLAGPAADASAGGSVATVRGDPAVASRVSTVDSVDGAAGQVVAVLALAQQASGGAGQYGAVHPADGAFPGAR